jgi:hypothetical protein
MLNSDLPIYIFILFFVCLEPQIYKTRAIEKGPPTVLTRKVINRLINIGLLRLWGAVLPLPALNEQ